MCSNTRSLEQWINELTESKDSEIREAVSEARLHQAALAKAEQVRQGDTRGSDSGGGARAVATDLPFCAGRNMAAATR